MYKGMDPMCDLFLVPKMMTSPHFLAHINLLTQEVEFVCFLRIILTFEIPHRFSQNLAIISKTYTLSFMHKQC